MLVKLYDLSSYGSISKFRPPPCYLMFNWNVTLAIISFMNATTIEVTRNDFIQICDDWFNQ